MTINETETITINIMDKAFDINCPKNKAEELRKTAAYINQRMQDIQGDKKSFDRERLAVITALNIAHDLLIYKQNVIAKHTVLKRLTKIKSKVEQILDAGQQSQ